MCILDSPDFLWWAAGVIFAVGAIGAWLVPDIDFFARMG